MTTSPSELLSEKEKQIHELIRECETLCRENDLQFSLHPSHGMGGYYGKRPQKKGYYDDYGFNGDHGDWGWYPSSKDQC
jgi:hypothetical protein